MDFIAGAQIKVLRAQLIADRFDPDEVTLSWANPLQIGPVYERVPVAPAQLIESATHEQPLRRIDNLMVILPYGADVTATDRIQIMDGPYAATYSVEGKPGHWRNPFTGWSAGTVVNLKDVV